MTPIATPRPRMKVPDFFAWADAHPEGRYELVDGAIVAIAPERVRHNLVKLAVATALQDAVRTAGVSCTVFTDGVAVVIDDETSREPDAALRCGVAADPDAICIAAPLLVVEVASPSGERQDLGAKLVEYFPVPSIRHYLIVIPDKSAVVHHRRAGGDIATRIARDGEIALDPPSLRIAVAALLGPSAAEAAS